MQNTDLRRLDTSCVVISMPLCYSEYVGSLIRVTLLYFRSLLAVRLLVRTILLIAGLVLLFVLGILGIAIVLLFVLHAAHLLFHKTRL